MDFNRRKRFATYGGALMTTVAFMAVMNGGAAGAASTDAVPAAATSTTAAGATTTSVGPTTTAGPTTTTTVGVTQVAISGKSNDLNTCMQSLNGGAPAAATLGVSIGATAFPQPHKGQAIKLTKTTATVTVGAALISQAVAAGLKNGDTIPSVVVTVISGAGTTEGTHSFTVNAVSTIHVVGGVAQPAVGTSSLPDTTWHPKNATDPVTFAEKSLKSTSTLTIPGVGAIVASTTCTPSTPAAGQFLALSAQGSAPPVTAGTTAPASVVTVAGATTPKTVAARAASTLPRTGANGVFLLIVGIAILDAGAALLVMTRRRTSRI